MPAVSPAAFLGEVVLAREDGGHLENRVDQDELYDELKRLREVGPSPSPADDDAGLVDISAELADER